MPPAIMSGTVPIAGLSISKCTDRRSDRRKIPELEIAKQIFRRPAFAHAGVATGIVLAAFGGITKHRVSFGDLFKPLGGIGIRISIGMIFHRQLAVGLFDSLLRGIAIDTEHFVVITFLLIGRGHGIFVDELASQIFVSSSCSKSGRSQSPLAVCIFMPWRRSVTSPMTVAGIAA